MYMYVCMCLLGKQPFKACTCSMAKAQWGQNSEGNTCIPLKILAGKSWGRGVGGGGAGKG